MFNVAMPLGLTVALAEEGGFPRPELTEAPEDAATDAQALGEQTAGEAQAQSDQQESISAEDVLALLEGEDAADAEMVEVIELTPEPEPIVQSNERGGAPLWGIIGLLVLVAALAAAVIRLLVTNGRLQKRLEEATAPKRPSAPGPVSQVRVGKLHAQGAREYQQDCFAVSDPALLPSHGMFAVVADGMGGLSDGDKVSVSAVETALNTFVMMRGRGTPEQILLTMAQRVVERVNRMLGPDGYRQSGSTLAMGLVKDSRFSFLSVGDSHIYLLRNGELMLLNREHTYKNDLVLEGVNGELELPEIYSNSQSGGLISYVGMGPLEHIDIPAEPLTVHAGDKLILMSDGVYNALSDEELCSALDAEPEAAAARLGELIEAKGYAKQDNYTAVILECI